MSNYILIRKTTPNIDPNREEPVWSDESKRYIEYLTRESTAMQELIDQYGVENCKVFEDVTDKWRVSKTKYRN